jgi:hypothetical protein
MRRGGVLHVVPVMPHILRIGQDAGSEALTLQWPSADHIHSLDGGVYSPRRVSSSATGWQARNVLPAIVAIIAAGRGLPNNTEPSMYRRSSSDR